MKGYSTFPKAPKLELHHLKQFSALPRRGVLLFNRGAVDVLILIKRERVCVCERERERERENRNKSELNIFFLLIPFLCGFFKSKSFFFFSSNIFFWFSLPGPFPRSLSAISKADYRRVNSTPYVDWTLCIYLLKLVKYDTRPQQWLGVLRAMFFFFCTQLTTPDGWRLFGTIYI